MEAAILELLTERQRKALHDYVASGAMEQVFTNVREYLKERMAQEAASANMENYLAFGAGLNNLDLLRGEMRMAAARIAEVILG